MFSTPVSLEPQKKKKKHPSNHVLPWYWNSIAETAASGPLSGSHRFTTPVHCTPSWGMKAASAESNSIFPILLSSSHLHFIFILCPPDGSRLLGFLSRPGLDTGSYSLQLAEFPPHFVASASSPAVMDGHGVIFHHNAHMNMSAWTSTAISFVPFWMSKS